MPAVAALPCALHQLPPAPTLADLEVGYAVRGAQILACDVARQQAVDTHAGEHLDEDAWLEAIAERRESLLERLIP